MDIDAEKRQGGPMPSRDTFKLWRTLAAWLSGDPVAVSALVAFAVVASVATVWVVVAVIGTGQRN